MDIKTDILDNLYDGVYIVDKKRRITYWNKAAERLTGFGRDEVLGKSCAHNILMHVDEKGESLCQGKCPLAYTLEDGTPREAEVFLHHKQGHRVPVLVRVAPIRDESGNITSAVEVFGDNTPRLESRQRIKELENIALLDALTALPNRRYLEDQLEARFAEFQRLHMQFGVLMLDIDHFKKVNDTYGHDIGDDVLKMVSRTMEANSRPYDIVGRWGGEEFLAIVPNADEKILAMVAERYRMLVEKSVLLHQNQPIKVTISIGGAIVHKEESVSDLIKRADDNLYLSKENGRNQVTIQD
jgi:diguanylate cyclase (GGDEF)-like protein/PAS domain S-box-containing protein